MDLIRIPPPRLDKHRRGEAAMFHDRVDAGRQLAKELVHYANREDVLILGIPRGGVPVAFEVAQALRAPLDIVLVRKLGTPGQASDTGHVENWLARLPVVESAS